MTKLYTKLIHVCAQCPNCKSYCADRFFCRIHTAKYADIESDLDYHLIPDIIGEIPSWCELEDVKE